MRSAAILVSVGWRLLDILKNLVNIPLADLSRVFAVRTVVYYFELHGIVLSSDTLFKCTQINSSSLIVRKFFYSRVWRLGARC